MTKSFLRSCSRRGNFVASTAISLLLNECVDVYVSETHVAAMRNRRGGFEYQLTMELCGVLHSR
jgi:hypothetical protein